MHSYIEQKINPFSVKKLTTMDLMAKENNYSKVSSDDSEDGRSTTFEIDIERMKDLPSSPDDKKPKYVFIRRPAINQVKQNCSSNDWGKFIKHSNILKEC